MGNQKRKAELERKRRTRRRAVIAAVVIAVVAAASVAYLLFIRDTSPALEASPNEASMFAGGSQSLLYADFSGGGEIHRLDVSDKQDDVVEELQQTGDTRAAPGSTWLSIQTSEPRAGDKAQPALHLFDTETAEATRLGVGFDPSWSTDGERLAWSKPADPTTCGEDACKGDISIVVTDPGTGETTPWTDPGPYALAGVAGDYLIVQDDSIEVSPILQSVSPEGEMQELTIRPIDYWGASPDGKWIVQSGESETKLFEFVDGQVAGAGGTIGIREGTKLGTGSWAPDSSHVAAFTAGADDPELLDVVTFRPNDPDPVVLTDGGKSGTGAVLWSPNNDGFVFQRLAGDELEAVYCPLQGECETLLTWTSGISLLRME